jgi:hypothetical protein
LKIADTIGCMKTRSRRYKGRKEKNAIDRSKD